MTTHSSIRRGPAGGAKRPRLSRRIAALFLSGVALGAGSLAVPSLAQAAGVETLYVSAPSRRTLRAPLPRRRLRLRLSPARSGVRSAGTRSASAGGSSPAPSRSAPT